MNIKSTNKAQDRFIISCGAEDDKTIRVWDFVEKVLVCEAPVPKDGYRATIYNLHLVCFDSPRSSIIPDPEQESDEFSKVILIVAVGIKDISIYTLNLSRLSLDFHLDSELSSPQGATYLDYSGVVKHSRDQYSVVIGQQKHLEVFRIHMEFESRPIASASGLPLSGEDLAQNHTRLGHNKDLRGPQAGFGQYALMANSGNDIYGLGTPGYIGNTRRASDDKKRFLPNPAIEPDSPYLRFRSPSKKLIDYRKSLAEHPDSPLIKSSEETPEPSLKSGKEISNYQENTAEKVKKVSEAPQKERSPRMNANRETKPSRFSQQRLPDEQTNESNRSPEGFLLTNPDCKSKRANPKQVVHINQAISEFSEESKNESSINESKKLRKQSSQRDIPALDGKVHSLRSLGSIHRGFSTGPVQNNHNKIAENTGSSKHERLVELQHEEFTLRKDSFKISPKLAAESGRRGSANSLILPERKQVSGLLGRRQGTFDGCPLIDVDGQPKEEEVPAVDQDKPARIGVFSAARPSIALNNLEISPENLALRQPAEGQQPKDSPSKRLPTSEDQSTRQIPPGVADLQVPPRSPVDSSLSGEGQRQMASSQQGQVDQPPPFNRQPSSISDISSET